MSRFAPLVAAAIACSCSRHRATDGECHAIFERMVELQLAELGYHDPVLAESKKAELERTLAPEIAACSGRRLDDAALACVRDARSSEDVGRCLR
jgi:hypothetical protein